MTWLDDFNAKTEGISHISTGSQLRDCRQCMASDFDIERLERESDDGETLPTEPYFSWSPCDTCGSTLGGNREDSHGIYDGALIHLACCTDCVVYIANSELPTEVSA